MEKIKQLLEKFIDKNYKKLSKRKLVALFAFGVAKKLALVAFIWLF